jgi:hypothetical protein
VSDCELDDRAIGVRSPAGEKDFSSILCVQTVSGAHPSSYPMGAGGPFSGGKARPVRDADRSPHPVPRSQMNRSYTSSPPSASFACSGTDLLYFNFYKSLYSYVNIIQRITYKNQVPCLYALMYSMTTALKKVANV